MVVLSTVAVEAPDALQHKGLSEVAHHLDQREADADAYIFAPRLSVAGTFQVPPAPLVKVWIDWLFIIHQPLLTSLPLNVNRQPHFSLRSLAPPTI